MRIEAYSQIQQMYKSNSVKKDQAGQKASFLDQLELSSMGKEIQSAKQAVAGSPDIREELVAPIKKAVDNGTYQVSPDSFAQKLYKNYSEMR